MFSGGLPTPLRMRRSSCLRSVSERRQRSRVRAGGMDVMTTTYGTLNGKVALVTGGSRGIGAATAVRLAREGADVAVTYVGGKEAASDVVRRVEALGRRAVALRAGSAGGGGGAGGGVRVAEG